MVVALKSRALPAADAVTMSLAAQTWLNDLGVHRVYFKYCSTFDSTDAGNIGPVTDALLDAADEAVTVVCPAAPEHGRTLYNGHLFVGNRLLSESSMARHPLTPMTDSDIVTVMGRQTPHSVGLIPLTSVRRGAHEIASSLATLRREGVRHVVVDAIDDDDLLALAAAAVDMGVITGSAGLAGALGKVLHARETDHTDVRPVPAPTGPTVIFAGSCSAATLGQVEQAMARYPSYRLDPRTVVRTTDLYPDALSWLGENLGATPVMIYSSAPASERGPADPAVAADLEAHDGCPGSGGRRGGRTPCRGRGRGNLGRRGRRIGDQGRGGQCRDGHRRAMVQHRRRRRPGDATAEIRELRHTGSARPRRDRHRTRMSGHHGRRVPTGIADQLVALGASLFARSLTFGRTGNLSALDDDGTLLLTPTGISLGDLTADELSRVDVATGEHVAGLPPTKEAFLHLAMYRARPSARAVVHAHSTHSVAVSCMRDINHDNAIPPLTAYYAMRVGTLPLLPYHAPGDPALGPLAEQLAATHHALLLANHGPIVAAIDLASAADALEELEETAKLHLLLHGHATAPVPDAEVTRLRDLYR